MISLCSWSICIYFVNPVNNNNSHITPFLSLHYFFSHYITLFFFSLFFFSLHDPFSLTLSTGCECCAPTLRVQSCVPNSSVTPRGQRAPVSMATKNCTKTPSTTGKPATVIFVTLKHVSRPSVQEHHSRPSDDPVLQGHDLFQSLI